MDILSRQVLKDVALDEIVPQPRRAPDPVHHWSTPVLLERAAYLRKMARAGNGVASETLHQYPQHTAELSFRARSSEVELDEEHAIQLYVLAGNATLLTGSAAAATQANMAEDAFASAAARASQKELRTGDVVHLPAGMPYQVLVTGEKSITCLVLRIRETA